MYQMSSLNSGLGTQGFIYYFTFVIFLEVVGYVQLKPAAPATD